MEHKIYRKLGVFGPRNSGKTTFWACLYGSKGSSDGSASFTDEATVKLLRPLWTQLSPEELSATTVLPATEQGEPLDISFQLHSHATTWHVSTKDYSGSLVELVHLPGAAVGSRDLRDRIAEWIRNCDAMLVLIPADLASQSDQTQIDFRRALEALLDVFHSSAHPSPLPVCLAVTKSDILATETQFGALGCESNDLLPDWLQEHVHLARNQVGQQNVKVFLTSAFGGHAEGDASIPPASGPGPKRLEQPLIWALGESDRCLFEAAQNAEQSTRRWPHRYKKAIRQCQRIAAKGLPLQKNEEFQALQGRMVKAFGKQRRRRIMVACTTILIGIFAGLYLQADSLKRSAESAMATDKVTRDSLKAIERFLESTNPACGTLFNNDQKRVKNYYDERLVVEARRVSDILAEKYDDPTTSHWLNRVEQASRRVEACQEFSKLFPLNFQFKEKQKDANTLIADLKKYGPFEDAFAHLIDQLKTQATSESMQKSYADFCIEYPRDKYPLKRDLYSEAEERIKAKKAGDEYWKLINRSDTISANYNKDPKVYSRHLETIKLWLSDYEKKPTMAPDEESGIAKTAQKLRGLEREIETAWDREDYETVKTSASRMFEGEDKLRNAISDADAYLGANRGLSAMKEHVGAWQVYARALYVTRGIKLQVASIKLWNSKFQDKIGKEHMRVVVTVRAASESAWAQWHATGVTEMANEGSFNTPAFPLSVPLTHLLKLEVVNYHAFSNDYGSKELSFLSLLGTAQKDGQTEADVTEDVDGAKVSLKLTDLPNRKELPPYGAPNR